MPILFSAKEDRIKDDANAPKTKGDLCPQIELNPVGQC